MTVHAAACPQDECITRKKVFNMMEDLKGKIRVFARVRPMLGFERERGQAMALNIPDELSLDHVWRDKKREYSFDAVFTPDASQDKARTFCTPKVTLACVLDPLDLCPCPMQSCGWSHVPCCRSSFGTHACMHACMPEAEQGIWCILTGSKLSGLLWLAQVFEDTRHLVQSAVDGYNVCIFACAGPPACPHPPHLA